VSDKQRPELSMRSPYYIGKHRYYELVHFCRQYALWRRELALLDGFKPQNWEISPGSYLADPTATEGEKRAMLSRKIDQVHKAAKQATENEELRRILLEGVVTGIGFPQLKARHAAAWLGKDTYYEAYRRFFWELNRIRCWD
jgi:hypothetical protein